MARRVDSAALDAIAPALALTGPAAGETFFEDNVLQQVLDIAELVRRGRTVGQSEGIFEATLRNVHAGAGTLISVANPYEIAVGAIEPWPVPVPPSLEIWLLQASARLVSGTGTFSGALFTNYDARTQAWGVDDSGVAVVVSNHQPVVRWGAIVANTFSMGVSDLGEYPKFRPFRLLRGFNPGTSLSFSSTASALVTFDCQLLLGLFPSGMGQDGSV